MEPAAELGRCRSHGLNDAGHALVPNGAKPRTFACGAAVPAAIPTWEKQAGRLLHFALIENPDSSQAHRNIANDILRPVSLVSVFGFP